MGSDLADRIARARYAISGTPTEPLLIQDPPSDEYDDPIGTTVLWFRGPDGRRHGVVAELNERVDADRMALGWNALPALLDVAEALASAKGVLWMAREYAEAGGSGGPEMRDLAAAEANVDTALSRLRGVLP